MSYYPLEYRNMPKEEKQAYKELLYINHPELKLLWKEYMTLKGKLERRALNLPVQGLSASMTKLACVFMSDWIWEQNLQNEVHIIISAHDEIIVEARERIEESSLKLQEFMENASVYYLKILTVPAEPLISTKWSK